MNILRRIPLEDEVDAAEEEREIPGLIGVGANNGVSSLPALPLATPLLSSSIA